jgi:hypothetical protein
MSSYTNGIFEIKLNMVSVNEIVCLAVCNSRTVGLWSPGFCRRVMSGYELFGETLVPYLWSGL